MNDPRVPYLYGQSEEPESGGRARPHRQPNRERVEYRSDDREEKDRSEVVEERAVRHEVTRVEDDWGQQVQEEGVRLERVALDVREEQDDPEQNAKDDQEAALGEDGRQLVVEVEA